MNRGLWCSLLACAVWAALGWTLFVTQWQQQQHRHQASRVRVAADISPADAQPTGTTSTLLCNVSRSVTGQLAHELREWARDRVKSYMDDPDARRHARERFWAYLQSIAATKSAGGGGVSGWMQPETAVIIAMISHWQRTTVAPAASGGLVGRLVEIGVHHGRSFLALRLASLPEEPSLVVDLFGEGQELHNTEGSGRGDMAAFRRNLARFGVVSRKGLAPPVILQGSSEEIWDEHLLEMAPLPGEEPPRQPLAQTPGAAPTPLCARMISVDGGHGYATVVHDLRIATCALCAGGVIVLDDFFNVDWPQVTQGMFAFLAAQGPSLRVVPFLMAYGAAFLTTPGHHARFLKLAKSSPHWGPVLKEHPSRLSWWQQGEAGRAPRRWEYVRYAYRRSLSSLKSALEECF